MLHFGITPALLTTSKAAAQLIFHFHQQWLQQNHLHDSNETDLAIFPNSSIDKKGISYLNMDCTPQSNNIISSYI
jgi:hypothetical protein